MGCRSVSNLIVPVGYDLEPLVAHWEANPGPVLHEGWARLVAWERSILQMQGKKAWSTPQCVFQHVDALAPSRPGVVHVVECPNGQLDDFIRPALSGLQVVVGHGFVSFGSTQCPGLFDFADGVDTFGLLANI